METQAPIRIALETIESSNLAAIGYDPARQILAVQFKQSGAIYHYAGVSLETVTAFYAAPSMGRYFATAIKAKYASAKMTGPCPKCGASGWLGDRCEDCGCEKYQADVRRPFRREFEPTRVLVNADLAALSPARATLAGVTPDVIFVRNDGWSLGAPKALEAAARSTWRAEWIERWQRKATGWERTWPLPGEEERR